MGFRMANNDLFCTDKQPPGKKLNIGVCVCPHWDAANRACLLVREGLFLPVAEHVAAYCLSGQYPLCVHYELLAGQDEYAEKNDVPPVNRRRSLRIPSRHLFRFSEITGSDQLPVIREDDAWTIDLSDHGIRFATRQQLALDTAVRFVVETGGTASLLRGSGRVVWSEPLENSPLFHAGIAFLDHPATTR